MDRRCKKWTKEEIDFLVDRWGTERNIVRLAGKLHRTVEGVIKKARKLKLGAYLDNGEGITYADLARAFGIYQSFHWYKQKLIKAGLPIYKKIVKNKKVDKIRLTDFWEWAAKNKEALNWSKLEKNILGEEPKWVDKQRKMDYKHRPIHTKKWTKLEHESLLYYLDKGLSSQEISKKLNKSVAAIDRRCYDYYLKKPKFTEKRRWTQEEIDKVVLLRKQGWNVRNISEETGISERCIRGKLYDVRKRLGVDFRPRIEEEAKALYKPWTKEEVEQIEELSKQGLDHHQIADVLGRTMFAVRQKIYETKRKSEKVG